MEEEKEIVYTSDRLLFLSPSESRDEDVHELYNCEDTMLPWLPMLCPMTRQKVKERRNFHREELKEGKSLFLDMVEKNGTKAFVGTSGFRAINVKKGEVEWGIVVKKEWQRSGLCSEAFEAALRYIRSDENDDKFKGIVSLRASTLPSNTPMINFFTKRGLKLRGTHFDDDDDQHDDKKQHQQRRGYKPPPLLEWQDYGARGNDNDNDNDNDMMASNWMHQQLHQRPSEAPIKIRITMKILN